LIAGKNHPGMAQQKDQKLKFFFGQRNRGILSDDFMGFCIHLQIAKGKDFFLKNSLVVPAAQGIDPGE
jgi:hypothetical protein